MSEDEKDITTMRLRIDGRVQAVGYRNFIIDKARQLSLDGWVRNRTDGTVEVLAAGTTGAIEALVAAAARGPEGSVIKHIDLERVDTPLEEKGFGRRPTV